MPQARSPLDSPSIGTAVNDLIEPRGASGQPKRERPAPPEPLPALAVAFSGGGFRATLAAVGVGRFLADAGLLGRVRCLSSVSGGSLANALVAHAWEELAVGGFAPADYDRLVVSRLVDRISESSLTASLPPEWLDGRPEAAWEEIVELALTATSFGKFPRPLCEKLVHRGWWLAGANISAYHPKLLGSLPRWRPLGA